MGRGQAEMQAVVGAHEEGLGHVIRVPTLDHRFADAMDAALREGVGKTRRELHEAEGLGPAALKFGTPRPQLFGVGTRRGPHLPRKLPRQTHLEGIEGDGDIFMYIYI